MSPLLALRSLGSSDALTKTLGTLDAAVLAALARDAADEALPPGSPLLHSDLLPELSRMLTAAGASQHPRTRVVSIACKVFRMTQSTMGAFRTG